MSYGSPKSEDHNNNFSRKEEESSKPSLIVSKKQASRDASPATNGVDGNQRKGSPRDASQQSCGSNWSDKGHPLGEEKNRPASKGASQGHEGDHMTMYPPVDDDDEANDIPAFQGINDEECKEL